MMKMFVLVSALAASPAPEAGKPAAASKEAPKAAKASPKADAKDAPKAAKEKKAAPKAGKQTVEAPPPPAAPPEPEEPPPPYKWRVPALVQWVDSAGVQVTDGVPMELRMAQSNMPVESLIQHFANEFEAAGLFIPPEEFQQSPYVTPRLTAFDPFRNVAYTVIFQPTSAKTTTLYLATADMGNYRPPGEAGLDWAPLMPGAKKLLRSQLESSLTAIYTAPATEVEVRAFYREKLLPLGYVEPEPGLFMRGGESLRVSSAPEEGGERTISLVRQLGPDPSASANEP